MQKTLLKYSKDNAEQREKTKTAARRGSAISWERKKVFRLNIYNESEAQKLFIVGNERQKRGWKLILKKYHDNESVQFFKTKMQANMKL